MPASLTMLLQQWTAACRAEALQFQHRAARHMHLQSEAVTSEAEAATWKLLSHLYANTTNTYPAGVGGCTTAVESVSILPCVLSDTSTNKHRPATQSRCSLQVHHLVAKHIANFPSLLRCARVVAWLEELASNSLDYAAEQGQGIAQCQLLRQQ